MVSVNGCTAAGLATALVPAAVRTNVQRTRAEALLCGLIDGGGGSRAGSPAAAGVGTSAASPTTSDGPAAWPDKTDGLEVPAEHRVASPREGRARSPAMPPAPTEAVGRAAAEAEVQSLRLPALRARAVAAGASVAQMEAADAAAGVRRAYGELLLRLHERARGAPPVATRLPTRQPSAPSRLPAGRLATPRCAARSAAGTPLRARAVDSVRVAITGLRCLSAAP
jgi:hypothetical protein